MLKAVTLLAMVTVVAHVTVTIYIEMKKEDKYFDFISSGRFLTEKYN